MNPFVISAEPREAFPIESDLVSTSALRRKLVGYTSANAYKTLACLIALVAFSGFFVDGCSKRGSVIESWETSNKTFKIRVTVREEKGRFLPGAYYVFECAPIDGNSWREVMTFRHDDRVDIPRDQVLFLNDKIGVVFMGWMYAVTTDGGNGWSVWNATNDLPNWQCCNYGLIRAVQLSANGAGTMTLNPIPQRRGEVPELQTKDYGRHWASQ